MFRKIIIANRGEIACRVIKTARRLGVKTVAVYSDADANALHVSLADEAVHIGASASSESYLQGERIIEAALRLGAEAVHPGYGFLSENAGFAQACADSGLVFIGPPVAAIKAMGSKSAAKTIMEKAGVPLVPGYHGDDQDSATLKASADEMGYPVLLKAVAGGGGKGMRQVWSADEFAQELKAAKRESQASFGNDDMLVEKYLTQPRHVEVQVFCDSDGEGVYLFERDCSVQRRHQKIIEEAPAPNLAKGLREEMGEAAVRAAQAIAYEGAGTVEFLLDTDGSFYFMEMNTRLQVEHPVTEFITGQDLVEWQLVVASGGKLPCKQDELTIRGHAFEARIYAEDPANDFLPTAGPLTTLRPPLESRNVRVDTGVVEGDQVTPFYDPMIAKLVVWGEDRNQALNLLADALSEYEVGGVTTNVVFLYQLATSQPFKDAELDTGFIEKHQEVVFREAESDWLTTVAMAGAYCMLSDKGQSVGSDPWRAKTGWRLNQPSDYRYRLQVGSKKYDVRLTSLPLMSELEVSVSEIHDIDAAADVNQALQRVESCVISVTLVDNVLTVDAMGYRSNAKVAVMGDSFALYTANGATLFKHLDKELGEDAIDQGNAFIAPMNGSIVEILVDQGQAVKAGELVMVMEAMKMQHSIKATEDGVVTELFCQQGDLVDGGTVLLDFEPSEKSE